ATSWAESTESRGINTPEHHQPPLCVSSCESLSIYVGPAAAIFHRNRTHVDFSLSFCDPKFAAFDSVRRHQYRSVFVLNEEHDEFRRFGLACVPPDDVHIIWAFVEALTRCQSHFLSAPHLHHD